MTYPTHRRTFLTAAAAGIAGVGTGDWRFLSALPPVSAAESRLDSQVVRFSDDVEPMVRLLEDSPRERLVEEVAIRVRDGLGYRELLASLFLAGVRNVQPRPSVGFKFHSVLVVNSAHLASVAGPPADRWLPIFWALDYFKAAQAQDEREGGWTMGAVDEAAVPAANEARRVFSNAMDNWDESAADVAAASLARHGGMEEVFELLFRYGCRDFRSIGHKAIFVANSRRTLEVIGWRHAEPVVRSLAYALLNHVGEPNPAESDLAPDRSWRVNQRLATELREDWQTGEPDANAAMRMLDVLRGSAAEEACRSAAQIINAGVHPALIWDALFTAAGEWVLRQPGIVALHAVTTVNALRYGYEAASEDATRRLLLLQAVAFVSLFRESLAGRGQVQDLRVEQLQAEPAADAGTALNTIFVNNRADPLAAGRQAMSYLRAGGDAQELIDAARRLVFVKGNDPHDYKYSSAVLEDYHHLSGGSRDAYLAACVGLLNSSSEPDNALVQRTRQALT